MYGTIPKVGMNQEVLAKYVGHLGSLSHNRTLTLKMNNSSFHKIDNNIKASLHISRTQTIYVPEPVHLF